MTLREQIVARARIEVDLKTPFVHQGRVSGVGCDCIGLLIIVGRLLGLVAPDFDIKGYSAIPDGKTLVTRARQFMTEIPRDEMQVGDAIVMRWGKDPQHLGILGNYVHGGLSFIHAYCEVDGVGSVIETHYAPTHRKRFVAAFRLPGVPA